MKLMKTIMFWLIEIANSFLIVGMIWGQFTWDFTDGLFGRLFLLFMTLFHIVIWLRMLQVIIKRIRDYVKSKKT